MFLGKFTAPLVEQRKNVQLSKIQMKWPTPPCCALFFCCAKWYNGMGKTASPFHTSYDGRRILPYHA